MKKLMRDIYVAAGSVDQSKTGIILFVISLAMFVIAAGAPDVGGGTVH